MRRIGLDTETTGLDFHHGTKPFFVTITDQDDNQTCWEWSVNPLTRQPVIPPGEVAEIQAEIDSADEIVVQNPKFDVAALATIGIENWPWEKTKDTLFAGHLLASNQPHDVSTMSLLRLGINLAPFEDRVKEATSAARTLARGKYKAWRIAKDGLSDMPSAKESTWKLDMWLPRAIARTCKYPKNHPWWTVLSDYSNGDSSVLIPLYDSQKAEMEARGLWDIYLVRLKLLPIIYRMEDRGITLQKDRLDSIQAEYAEEAAEAGKVCLGIAKSYGVDLVLPKSGNNNSLKSFVFDTLKLPVVKKADSGGPSMDKFAIAIWQDTLPEHSKALTFVNRLQAKRQRDTAVNYMESYKTFWIPVLVDETGTGWYRLYPSLNPTGTATLRWSSSNPNEQNISKKRGFNIRYCFGPLPGREWWSCDAQNIELRIPAYEAGEEVMIDLFERPNDPPYFGSNHLLAFDTLHPELFAEHGKKVKDLFDSTWYQWTKNGNFAVQYGAQEYSGTADRAYHVPGAQARIQNRLGKIKNLNEEMIERANLTGYVETIPDKNVCSERGYPLYCTRTRWGDVKPTVPLSYHVQGTAMWWMMKAMIRCDEYLETLDDYFMVMQVHDELVFDFPKGEGSEPWKMNRPVVAEIQRLMSLGGDDIGVPTPVSCKYHADTWSEGIEV